MGIRLIGKQRILEDGYLIDFGQVKSVVAQMCKELNEHFLLPAKSQVIQWEENERIIILRCEDGCEFSMPKNDVVKLPIEYSSAEELARYLWGRIVDEFSLAFLHQRGVRAMEVTVAEAPNQQATYRRQIPPPHSKIEEDDRNTTVNASPCLDR